MFSKISKTRFIEDVINGMNDWVRVIDREDNVIYLNKAMADAVNGSAAAGKCYETLGRKSPCENCTSRRAVFEGLPQHKEEIIGDRIFSVMSSPIINDLGEVTAVVEVLRDITDTKTLQKKIIEQNRKLQYDLEIAKKLQCSLLPKGLPEDKLKFSYVYKPCETLGGDFLDIYKIDDRHVGIYIADVSGHGVPASMLTIFLRSTIDKKELSPAKALSKLYDEYNRSSFDHDLYITVFYSILDIEAKTMVYSNAGHNVLPVITGEGRFDLLRSPGIPISDWMDKPDYKDVCTNLKSSDKIFYYTDGIVELKNSKGEQFGEERLLSILLDKPSGPDSTLNKVIESASGFSGEKDISKVCDDITIALLEVL